MTTGAAPILCVADPLASAEFYGRAFGFERRRYFDGNDAYVVIGRGSAELHLMAAPHVKPNHVQAAHVADVFVWVDDLDAVVAEAATAGLTPERGPEHYDSSPVATTEVVFPDPDGYWVCFARRD